MRTLAINYALRNLRLQNKKLARCGQRYHGTTELIAACERPAAMAWATLFSRIGRRAPSHGA
ncbi:hypothetical protein NMD14_03050 [Aeromonas veronii]